MPAPHHLRLGVNIDHVATVRNARGGKLPDPLRAARLAEAAGADGITAHLREDRRHIVDADIEGLMRELKVPLNFEMAATQEMVDIALAPSPARRLHRAREARGADDRGRARRGRPAQSPEADGRPPERRRHPRLAVHRGRSAPARGGGDAWAPRSSSCIPAATASSRATRNAPSWRVCKKAAALCARLGLECHAGHGLSYADVGPVAAIPEVRELNIGHFLVGEAIFVGLEQAIREMRRVMDAARAAGAAA